MKSVLWLWYGSQLRQDLYISHFYTNVSIHQIHSMNPSYYHTTEVSRWRQSYLIDRILIDSKFDFERVNYPRLMVAAGYTFTRNDKKMIKLKRYHVDTRTQKSYRAAIITGIDLYPAICDIVAFRNTFCVYCNNSIVDEYFKFYEMLKHQQRNNTLSSTSFSRDPFYQGALLRL